jgi:drug/metabolite transporter (DMT)-like permease
MLTAVLGLVGALIFGSADFLGGLAAKRISSVLVTAVAAFSGLVALLIVLPFVGGVWSGPAVLWGALSGVSGAAAISLLYACLAIGPMSILSPLTAVISAIVPMAAGLLGGERLAPLGYWALGVALVAVVLVGFVPERGAVRPRPLGIVMAIGSGTMIGVFLIMIDLTPDDSGLVPLVLNRAVNGSIMWALLGVVTLVALRRRRAARIPAGTDAAALLPEAAARARREAVTTGLRLAVVCGIIDVIANVLLLIGIRVGDLSVMSVLTAMYPAGTILLAAVVLKERIAPVQWLGLGLALAAAAMLAVA